MTDDEVSGFLPYGVLPEIGFHWDKNTGVCPAKGLRQQGKLFVPRMVVLRSLSWDWESGHGVEVNDRFGFACSDQTYAAWFG